MSANKHDDVIKWKHFPHYWPFFAGNSLVPGEFPAQRPVTRSFDVFFDLRPNKRLSKQWWGLWFETPSSPLWRHCNEIKITFRAWSRLTDRSLITHCGLMVPYGIRDRDPVFWYWAIRLYFQCWKKNFWYWKIKIFSDIRKLFSHIRKSS